MGVGERVSAPYPLILWKSVRGKERVCGSGCAQVCEKKGVRISID